MSRHDLRIYYLLCVPDSDPTMLQGFSLGLNPYLVRLTALLPSTILEFVPEHHKLRLPQKLCGLLPINWHPLSPASILAQPGVAQIPFVVLVLGNDQIPADFFDWAKASVVPPTIVANEQGDLTYRLGTTMAPQQFSGFAQIWDL